MEKRLNLPERENTSLSVPLKADYFDRWGIDPNSVYTVVVINKNEDLPNGKPDLGVIITMADGSKLAHIIEQSHAIVAEGDNVKFYKE